MINGEDQQRKINSLITDYPDYPELPDCPESIESADVLFNFLISFYLLS